MRKLFYIFFVGIFLQNCSQNHSVDLHEILLSDTGEWDFVRKDFVKPNNEIIAKIVFENKNTFLNKTLNKTEYWSYNSVNKVLKINDQEFEIIQITNKRIILNNKKLHYTAVLNKD